MQAIMETLFDIVYLVTVITMGIIMVKKSRLVPGGNSTQIKLFGIMAIVLGCGDAFHLTPRAYSPCTDGLAAHAAALGIGKLITSVTMTVFYLILFEIWKMRYDKKNQKNMTIIMYVLAAIRVALCLFPQNAWTDPKAPVLWGIYRNIPFAFMGILIIVLFYKESKSKQDKSFRFMWLAITLSFAFYIPVVLWADLYPIVGILMIPKTCAYVWVVYMGFHEMSITSQPHRP